MSHGERLDAIAKVIYMWADRLGHGRPEEDWRHGRMMQSLNAATIQWLISDRYVEEAAATVRRLGLELLEQKLPDLERISEVEALIVSGVMSPTEYIVAHSLYVHRGIRHQDRHDMGLRKFVACINREAFTRSFHSGGAATFLAGDISFLIELFGEAKKIATDRINENAKKTGLDMASFGRDDW